MQLMNSYYINTVIVCQGIGESGTDDRKSRTCFEYFEQSELDRAEGIPQACTLYCDRYFLIDIPRIQLLRM